MTTTDDRLLEINHRIVRALEAHHWPRLAQISDARQKLRAALSRIDDDAPPDEVLAARERALAMFDAAIAPYI